MSAWTDLVNSEGSDEHLELCNRALAEVRRELLEGLLRNLTEVRLQQQATKPHVRTMRQEGTIEGLNIAIAAVRRRMR